MARTLWKATLSERETPIGFRYGETRCVRLSDVDDLAHLLLKAFGGTPDEMGGDIEPYASKLVALLGAKYGTVRDTASFIVGSKPAGMILVTDYEPHGCPTIALIAVSPPHQRQKLARSMLRQSMDILAAENEKYCCAAISPDNAASRALFSSLGFRPAQYTAT